MARKTRKITSTNTGLISHRTTSLVPVSVFATIHSRSLEDRPNRFNGQSRLIMSHSYPVWPCPIGSATPEAGWSVGECRYTDSGPFGDGPYAKLGNLLFRAAVHDHSQPGGFSTSGTGFVDHADLQPQHRNLLLNGLVDHRIGAFRGQEQLGHVDRFGQ